MLAGKGFTGSGGASQFRGIVHQTTYSSVHSTFRSNQQFAHLRQRFPGVAPNLLTTVWQPHLVIARNYSSSRVTNWFPQWLQSWRAAAPQATPQQQAPQQPQDPKRLTVDQLRIMRAQHNDYVVHRTWNQSAGTCQEALVAETDQSKMVNPMAAVGVYAALGLQGLKDYGPYGVVFLKSSTGWAPLAGDQLTWYNSASSLSPDQAVGWYHEDDLKKAYEDVD